MTSHSQSESDLPVGLAKPAQRALANAGITRLCQLTTLREADIKQMHGMGPRRSASFEMPSPRAVCRSQTTIEYDFHQQSSSLGVRNPSAP